MLASTLMNANKRPRWWMLAFCELWHQALLAAAEGKWTLLTCYCCTLWNRKKTSSKMTGVCRIQNSVVVFWRQIWYTCLIRCVGQQPSVPVSVNNNNKAVSRWFWGWGRWYPRSPSSCAIKTPLSNSGPVFRTSVSLSTVISHDGRNSL